MTDTQASTYDEVSYGGNCFFYTHPDTLATVATLFGMDPPSVERCRVLELGWLTVEPHPMALDLPGPDSSGSTSSPRQINDGARRSRRWVCEHRTGTDQPHGRGGRFRRVDFVICHGVYLVGPGGRPGPDPRVPATNLTPDGVAYVSYNTYPGWHARGLARDLMGFHVLRIASAKARATEARATLENMVRVLPDPVAPTTNPFAKAGAGRVSPIPTFSTSTWRRKTIPSTSTSSPSGPRERG